MATLHRVASIHEIPSGTGKTVAVDGRRLGIFNVKGKFHALDNTCPHRQGPLAEGTLNQNLVACPWHGWRFDLATGACLTHPTAKVAVHPIAIKGEDIFVQFEL